jgi:hypothetical protein
MLNIQQLMLMNVYMVFRIVLGIIASFFILYFLIYYSGVYSEMQRHTQCMMITQNFIKASEDVYLSGNGLGFDDFSRLDCETEFDGLVDPAVISTMAGQQRVRLPVLFVPGDSLLIEKRTLDYGWWKFDFVEALPDMTIVFNPTVVNSDTIGLMNSIVDMFPDTTGSTPKIRFGFCSGGTIIKPCDGGASFCEGFRFFSHVDNLAVPMADCSLAGPGQTLVKVSSSCPGTNSSGICIEPPAPTGIGAAYVNGSADTYHYKISFSGTRSNNPIDLVALIVGGDRRNGLGLIADNLYHHENEHFRKELELMSKVMWHRSQLIAQNLPGQPGQYSENQKCRELHTQLMGPLNAINAIVSDTGSSIPYYKNPSSSAGLLQEMANADGIYQDIVANGCDYVVE